MQSQGASAPTSSRSKRAVGFFKIAAGSADDQRRLLVEQRQAFYAFCAKRGYEPSGMFAQTNGSGSGAAEGYRDLLASLRRDGGVVTVVIPSLDVLGAKRDEAAIALLELQEAGAQVQLLDGTVLDPVRVATVPWLKPQNGQDLSERIKSAMRSRAIRGEGLGKPPYGYRIGKTRKLEIQPHEADVVRMVFSLYTQKNQGIRLIVRHLNEQGIPTRKGGKWSMVTIRDILRNRAYLGTYTRFGMRVPGSHPAIITPDMFRWAQAKLEERKPKRTNGQAEPFLLSGLVYCGYCGNRMVGVTRKQAWTRRKDGSRAEKQYRYYQCQSRTNQSVCQYHTRRAAELEARVLEYVQAQRPRLDASKGLESASSAPATPRERQKVEAALNGVNRRLRQTLRMAASGAIGQQRFRSMASQLIRTRRELEERLLSLDRLVPGAQHGPSQVHQAIGAMDRLAKEGASMDLAVKRALLQGLVEGIIVFDDRIEMRLKL